MPTALAILTVLIVYAYFASGGTFSFRRIPWDESLYARLAEGFRRGHLYLPDEPDPRLMALPYPYDYKARERVDYLWDASYLNGRYYLYFSPLPAIAVYMPHRILRGGYPRDALVAAIFSAWAFLAAVGFTGRALALSGRPRQLPFPLWVFLIGLGNVCAFLLTDIRIYEVAAFAGAAMTATWAYSLLRFVESPTRVRAVWLGLWLALSVLARPNVVVLFFVTVASIISVTKGRSALLRTLCSFLAPLTTVALAMLWYNEARFGGPLEFGVRYQLTFTSMEGKSVCHLCGLAEVTRFVNSAIHYIAWPPIVQSHFPFVHLQYTQLDPSVSFPMPRPEEVVGVGSLVPVTLLGTMIAILFSLSSNPVDVGTRVAVRVMVGAWLILLSLSTCWWVVTRYDLDFMILMAAATVVCVEAGLSSLTGTGIRMVWLRIALAAMVCYSIVVGFLLGFSGEEDAFRRLHPALFERISHWFR